MRRLPNINDVVAKIKDRATEKVAELEKKAEEEATPSFSIPAAQNMHKLAQRLRNSDPNRITYRDMRDFVQQLTG